MDTCSLSIVIRSEYSLMIFSNLNRFSCFVTFKASFHFLSYSTFGAVSGIFFNDCPHKIRFDILYLNFWLWDFFRLTFWQFGCRWGGLNVHIDLVAIFLHFEDFEQRYCFSMSIFEPWLLTVTFNLFSSFSENPKPIMITPFCECFNEFETNFFITLLSL